MLRPIKAEDWIPIDDLNLEPTALEAVKSCENSCVIAGPGAGKTELLAQRASFLLQTGDCQAPRKILALSYKKDAAQNIAERVRKRVGGQLSSRFVSLTYDAFAKRLLDHFIYALPEGFRPQPDYKISSTAHTAYLYLKGTQSLSREERQFLHQYFVVNVINLPYENDVPEVIRRTWDLMLKGDDNFESALTFPMISCLAEYLIRINPKIKKALALTYSHVFLDEFQDTTQMQYKLVKSCFCRQSTIVTAVGDNKQRIMIWAGADTEIFSNLERDFNSIQKHLLMNYRSAPRLVEIQRILAKNLTGEDYAVTPRTTWNAEDGECEVWLFNNAAQEATRIIEQLEQCLSVEGINPRDICVIVRQQAAQYGQLLIETAAKSGILIRNENLYQDLLSEECNTIILDLISLAFDQRNPTAYENTISMLNLIRNVDGSEDYKKLRKIGEQFELFVVNLKKNFLAVEDCSMLEQQCWDVLGFLDIEILKNMFPQYRRGDYLAQQVHKISQLLSQEYEIKQKWDDAVQSLKGEFSIPLMTIHKSKGLEYETVIFLGLEDGAFWNFGRQQQEETCAFFVALSRAKNRIIFTFSKNREVGRNSTQSWTGIQKLYDMLGESKIAQLVDYRKCT